jgi:mono/diheme cytochrome c family protein
MRASLVGAIALFVAGCGSFGHWGSSDTPPDYGPEPGYDAGAPATGLDFGTTRHLDKAPPPLSGGTLAMAVVTKPSGTRRFAVVADPDRDAVYIVNVDSKAVTTIPLQEGDEPGRVTTDGAGIAFVALRSGGAVLAIDVELGTILSRRAVCAAPRGVAFDASAKAIHVACSGGELVTLPAAGGDATRTLHLDLDLRDVVLGQQGQLFVSRFRSAEVLTVSSEGKVTTRFTPPDNVTPFMTPAIAWRMIPGANGASPIVLHQLASRLIDNHATGGIVPPYYSGSGGGCGGFGGTAPAVATAMTRLDTPTDSVGIPSVTLPVDMATGPDGYAYAVVAAAEGHTGFASSLVAFDTSALYSTTTSRCVSASGRTLTGQITSVAFADNVTIVAFSREPAAVFVAPFDAAGAVVQIDIPNAVSREDTGHAIFHSDTGAGVACASCHAEGGDDGLVWSFAAQGRRRTPSLRGTLQGTAPYHWSGELSGVDALVQKVYQEGMAGPDLLGAQKDALGGWLFSIPSPRALAPNDAASIVRGRALFEGTAGCSTCHTGERFTNNATVDVGTGGAFQVPSLVGVAHRAPYLHAGCAQTLTDRFGSCGGGDKHGTTSTLSSAEVADLVAYLSTL